MQIDPHHKYNTCGGPPCCRYCGAILGESPEEAASRLAAEDAARGFRSAAFRANTNEGARRDALGRELQGYGSVQLDALPDPYEEPLKRLRAAQGIPDAPDHTDALWAMAELRHRYLEQALIARLGLPPATNAVYANPPDPYAAALAARSKEKTR